MHLPVGYPGDTQGGPGSGLMKTYISSHVNSSEVAHSVSHGASCSWTGISLSISISYHSTCLGLHYAQFWSCRMLIYKKPVRNNEQDQTETNVTVVRGSVLLTSGGSNRWSKLAFPGSAAWLGNCSHEGAKPTISWQHNCSKTKKCCFPGGLAWHIVVQSWGNNVHVALSALQWY